MNFINLALFASLLVVAISAEIGENFEIVLPDVESEMPIKVTPPKDKPPHGTCYYNEALTCPLAGVVISADPVNPCVDCVCTVDNKIYCCRRKPEPIMADPERCPLTQHQVTCDYKFPRCKKCQILGWYTSVVPGDWFDDVPEGGLEYAV